MVTLNFFSGRNEAILTFIEHILCASYYTNTFFTLIASFNLKMTSWDGCFFNPPFYSLRTCVFEKLRNFPRANQLANSRARVPILDL